MKKKPPPGATLIARLREQRLAREQSLKADAAEDTASESTSVVDAGEQGGKAQISETQPETSSRAVKRKAGETLPVPEAHGSLVPVGRMEIVPVESQTRSLEPFAAVTDAPVTALAGKGGADLINREIDIDDLRPTSDDYFQLTDEIRLAGRFAAVGLIAQGLRLARIRDENIYKSYYQTFDEYCRKEHQMSATYAYRLMRMAEMAEKVAELGMRSQGTPEAMPDPFEVMIGLGHRHLMALLPLEVEAAEDLLLHGIPVAAENEGQVERVPIARATERQIRAALKVIAPVSGPAPEKTPEKKTLASEKQLIPALSKLAEMLEDWASWLGGEAPPELKAARSDRAPLLKKLSRRVRNAGQCIADALERAD